MDKKLKDIFVILAHLSRKKERKLFKVYEKAKCISSLFRKVAHFTVHPKVRKPKIKSPDSSFRILLP